MFADAGGCGASVALFGAKMRSLFCLAVLLTPIAAPSGAVAQQQVQIPLSGTLPVRCNAFVHDLQVQPGSPERLILTITHKCNKGHALHLRVVPGSGATLDRTNMKYAGRGPTFRNSIEATFRYPTPTEGDDLLTIELPPGFAMSASKIAENLILTVLSD
jgi:hypothetical protein